MKVGKSWDFSHTSKKWKQRSKKSTKTMIQSRGNNEKYRPKTMHAIKKKNWKKKEKSLCFNFYLGKYF